MPAVTVVGAGVAGLTLAHQLAGQGWDVTVLESHHEVGGMLAGFSTSQFISLFVVPISIVMLILLARRGGPAPQAHAKRARAA